MRRNSMISLGLLLLCCALLTCLTLGCAESNTGLSGGMYQTPAGDVVGVPNVIIRTTVQGENGVPVTNASVTIGQPNADLRENISYTTDSQGVFTATLPFGSSYDFIITGGFCGSNKSLSELHFSRTLTGTSERQELIVYKPSRFGPAYATIPDAVALTAATNAQSGGAQLTWSISKAENFYSYRIFRTTSPGVTVNANLVAEIKDISTNYFSDIATDGGIYYYRVYNVISSSAGRAAAGSNEVSATISGANTPGNTAYLTFMGGGAVSAAVYATSTALPNGSYSAAKPDGTVETLAHNAGSVWTVSRTFIGSPVAGSYGSVIDTSIDPQRYGQILSSSGIGGYAINTPTTSAAYNVGLGSPAAMAPQAVAQTDGTILVTWDDMGPNYRYLVVAATENSQTKTIGTRWSNIDVGIFNEQNPVEFFSNGMQSLIDGTTCTVPAVFFNKDKVTVRVTAYDITNSTLKTIGNNFGQALLYAAYTQTPPVVTVVGTPQSGIYALFVGINAYAPPNELYQCVNDANGMNQSLTQSTLWNGATVVNLLDADATKANILGKIQELGSQAVEGTTFFFYYSGHGSNGKGDAYIVPVDQNGTLDSWISDVELKAVLDPIAGNKCIIFDSCNSGGFVGKETGGKARYFKGPYSDDNYNGNGFARQLANVTGLVFLAACKGSELSYESPDLGHGYFTYYLIQGLGNGSTIGPADTNGSGIIAAKGLFDYAMPLVQVYSSNVQNPQMQDNVPAGLPIKQ
jgi:uncharacterized caspase-like protein